MNVLKLLLTSTRQMGHGGVGTTERRRVQSEKVRRRARPNGSPCRSRDDVVGRKLPGMMDRKQSRSVEVR